jgi:DNA polymerase III alpha subunit
LGIGRRSRVTLSAARTAAYGVEAYQGAYLKRYHSVEFLACVLSKGKGFYSTPAYTLV